MMHGGPLRLPEARLLRDVAIGKPPRRSSICFV